MPHGLTEATARALLDTGKPWLRHLKFEKKGAGLLKLLRLEGAYAVVERMNRPGEVTRIAVEKLDRWQGPLPKIERKPPPPPPKPIAPEPPTRVIANPSPRPRPAPPPPPPPKPNPREIAMARARDKRRGAFVLYDAGAKTFYTPTHKWVAELAIAAIYESEGGANRARGRLLGKGGRGVGRDLQVLAQAEAKRQYDERLGIASSEPPAEPPSAPEAPATEPVGTGVSPLVAKAREELKRELATTTAPLVATAPAGLAEAFMALEKARREEAQAKALALELAGKRLIAETDFELQQLRLQHGIA